MLDDFRSGLRQIRRNPGFAAAAILTLALGVGATTAVFTLADPMLFRPLPYPEADRIVTLRAAGQKSVGGMLQAADFFRLETGHSAFEAVAEFDPASVGRLSGQDESTLSYGVTSGFFDVLRVRPAIGRVFLSEEYRTDNVKPDVALITYGLWQSRFAGRPDVLDQILELGSARPGRFRIVGVLPREFVFPDHVNQAPQFLVPRVPDPATQSSPNRLSAPIARLAPGVSPEIAAAQVQAVLGSVERDFVGLPQGRTARVRPLQELLFGRVRTPLLMLLAATGCVLLLACANLAHLFMARLQARQRELGVRLALGAGRWRLARLLTIEAAIFAAAGGVMALVFGQWTFDLIMARTPQFAHVYRLLPARLDWRVAAFAALLVGVALAIFGGIPALRAARTDIRSSLQNGALGTGVRRGVRSDAWLIFVQSAVAVTLLVTGALIVRSFARLVYQPLGFEPQYVRTIGLELPGAVDTPSDRAALIQARREIHDRLRERLRVPVTVAGGWPGVTFPGAVVRPDAPKGPRPTAYPAAGSFFEVFGTRLLRGRLYDDGEAFGNPAVALIDRQAADKLWPGEDALGREVRDWQGTSRVVVGIVETLRTSLTNDNRDGTAFVPFGPQPRAMDPAFRDPGTNVSLEQVRATVREVAPGAEVWVRPFRPFERTLGQPRFLASLLGTLGLLTIALTIVGIFGVVNHEVARRTREVGIRMSLGADARRIRRMVVGRALIPALMGVAAGVGASLWWTRTLRALLFGLQPNDPSTFTMSGALVVVLVMAASLLPAWRASRVDPVVALRFE